MADETKVHIGENSAEQVAFKMAEKILIVIEHKDMTKITRDEYLSTYAECLYTIQNPSTRVPADKKRKPQVF